MTEGNGCAIVSRAYPHVTRWGCDKPSYQIRPFAPTCHTRRAYSGAFQVGMPTAIVRCMTTTKIAPGEYLVHMADGSYRLTRVNLGYGTEWKLYELADPQDEGTWIDTFSTKRAALAYLGYLDYLGA